MCIVGDRTKISSCRTHIYTYILFWLCLLLYTFRCWRSLYNIEGRLYRWLSARLQKLQCISTKILQSCTKLLVYGFPAHSHCGYSTYLPTGHLPLQPSVCEWAGKKQSWGYTRPPLERRKTLGHLRSINPNMINHYASQSQTCQLLKISKNIFFQTNKMWKLVQSGWTDIQNPYRLSRGCIYIYIISYHIIYMWSSWHRILMISRNLPGGR